MKKKSRRIIAWLLALALAITGLTLPAAPAHAGGAVDIGDIVQGTNGDGTITAGATVYVTLASLDDAYEEDFAWLYDKGEVICTFQIGDQSVTAARKNNRFSYTTSAADVGKTLCFFTETTGNDTYYNNNTRSYTIIKGPVLSASKKTLYVGESYRLKIKDQIGDVVFTSSDPKVAGVTRGGTIKAKRKGSCVITAQTGGVKLKCKVTVLNPKLSKTRLLTYNSEKTKLQFYGGTGDITWRSSDKKVARVSSNGTVRGVKSGSCTITAVRGKYTLSCLVKVSSVTRFCKKLPDFGARFGIVSFQSEWDEYDAEWVRASYRATKSQVMEYIKLLKKKGFKYTKKKNWRGEKIYGLTEEYEIGILFKDDVAEISYYHWVDD